MLRSDDRVANESLRSSTPRGCRVWILNHYATPPDRGAGTRHFLLGRELVRMGFDVTIFAAALEHATGVDTRLRAKSLSKTEMFQQVRFVWLRTMPYRGNDWRRVLNMLSYVLMVIVAQIGRPRPDVVVGSTVHPFAAFGGWMIARLRRARFVYEVRDLWPQTLLDIGAMKSRNPGVVLLGWLEAFLVRRAEAVVTVLPGMARYLDTKGLPTEHVWYVPNGADLKAADGGVTTPRGSDDSLAPLLEDLAGWRAEGDVVFAWLGAHGHVNRLDVVIRALAEARARGGPPMRILFVGDGPEKAKLQELAASLSLAEAVFVDPIPKDRVPDVLAAIDVGLCHYAATPVYRYGVSFNKLFDYMGARKPIVFACETFRDPVALAGAGLTVRPDDPAALAAALVEMAHASPRERRRMGDAGRAFAEREHDVERLGEAYAAALGCLPAGSSDRPEAVG